MTLGAMGGEESMHGESVSPLFLHSASHFQIAVSLSYLLLTEYAEMSLEGKTSPMYWTSLQRWLIDNQVQNETRIFNPNMLQPHPSGFQLMAAPYV